MGPSFFDTNVLIYAVGDTGDRREEIARELIAKLIKSGNFRTSTQVLQEFYVTHTRNARSAKAPNRALEYMEVFADWPVFAPSYLDIRDAAHLSQTAQISYWDALIVVAARLSGCAVLYTEDLNHGQLIEGVRIINPFATTIH